MPVLLVHGDQDDLVPIQSLPEAAEVTRYPQGVCRLQLERMLDEGILRRTNGRFRLTTHWHRAVVRFLKRGNLLSD